MKLLVFAAALVPFAHLVWRGFNGDLTADPLVEITNETGIWTLRFVVITLAITPIRRLSGWNTIVVAVNIQSAITTYRATLATTCASRLQLLTSR